MDGVKTHSGRVDWVDYAKGFCIIFVVMMHSTLGVEAAVGHDGWLHGVVEFARPFRMPDFFMISGLFLAQVIDRDWRTYIDRKVVHFAYFYLLWMTIQFAIKAPGIAAESGVAEVARLYLLSLIDPFGTLWFIYLLPIFFVVVKLTRRVPWPVIWLHRRRAGNRACRNRLDGAGRIRRPLRLFLHRLHSRALHLRLHRARAGAAGARRLAVSCCGACSTARWCTPAMRRCRSSRSRSA